MSIINAELNVKKNDSEYDQLHLVGDASLINYENEKIPSVESVKAMLDYIVNGDFITLTGQDVLNYFVNNQQANSCITVRGIDNPTASSPIPTPNDIYYISFKRDSSFINVIAFDSMTNNIFSIARLGGNWNTWRDVRNAHSFDGFERVAFMQYYKDGTGVGINITSNTVPQPYVTNISGTQANTIGLPINEWILMYVPSRDSGGLACQIAFPLNITTQKPKYRNTIGNTWQEWKSMGGGGATISTIAPTDTEALWIDSSGLMKYYNGSAWVAVKTNAVWS